MLPIRRLVATSVAVLMVSVIVLPPDALAQRGHVQMLASRRVAIAPYYYHGPVLFDPWFSPWGWYPPGAYGAVYDRGASLRVQVMPRDTEVFVNGYYAGIVDDFDGTFQRLHLPPGEHDIQLYTPGHRLVERKIFLQPGGTFRIRHTMEPLHPGEATPARPSGRPATTPPVPTP